MNLALIGYRGTGKTTVARALSQRLGWQAIDADTQLEIQAGRTIKQIFADNGEQTFRDLETRILNELCAHNEHVLSLGGGVILRPENRATIKSHCVTAWLTASSATLLARIHSDPITSERRPNLTAAGGLTEIEQLMAVREPYYRECADCIVATDERSPETIAAEILRQLGPRLHVTK